MDDEANARMIDAHAEGDRRHDHVDLTISPALLDLLLVRVGYWEYN